MILRHLKWIGFTCAVAATCLLAGSGNAIAQTPAPSKSPETLKEKLSSIIIDEVDFNHTNMAEALEFLSNKSKALTSDKKGVHFALRLSFEPPSTPGAAPAVDSRIHPEVTMKLSNASLADILAQVAAQTGLIYNIENADVQFYPPLEDSTTVVERTYSSVPPNFFAGKQFMRTSPADDHPVDVKAELASRGITFPADGSAYFTPGKTPSDPGKLVVQNLPSQLDEITLLFDLMQRDTRLPVEIKN